LIVGIRKGSISLTGFFLEVNAYILEKATLLLCIYHQQHLIECYVQEGLVVQGCVKNQHNAPAIDCFNWCLGIIETPDNPNYLDQFIKQVKIYTDGHPLTFRLEDTGGLGRSLTYFLTTSDQTEEPGTLPY